jgi:Flp pilus assembly protein TadD
MDPYASFAEALLAEAEAFGGDPERATRLAREQLELTDRHLPLLARVSGIALARLGRIGEARDELRGALQAARERRSEYDLAATIDVIDMLEGAADELLRERDAIVARLRITRLPAPALAGAASGATPASTHRFGYG